ERARSQCGNNNAYCQDNELTWFNWDLDSSQQRLLDFTSKLIEFRRSHPNLHRRKFFQDRVIRNSLVRDIAWYGSDGQEMPDDVWNAEWVRCLSLVLNGKTLQITDENGKAIMDESF